MDDQLGEVFLEEREPTETELKVIIILASLFEFINCTRILQCFSLLILNTASGSLQRCGPNVYYVSFAGFTFVSLLFFPETCKETHPDLLFPYLVTHLLTLSFKRRKSSANVC